MFSIGVLESFIDGLVHPSVSKSRDTHIGMLVIVFRTDEELASKAISGDE